MRKIDELIDLIDEGFIATTEDIRDWGNQELPGFDTPGTCSECGSGNHADWFGPGCYFCSHPDGLRRVVKGNEFCSVFKEREVAE